MAHNLERVGFALSRPVIDNWSAADPADVIRVGTQLSAVARELVGDHVAHTAMYPNFPAQVMAASDAELYLNAFLHYYGDLIGARIMPVYQAAPRRHRRDPQILMRPVGLAADDEITALASSLMAANGGLSPTDRDDLRVLARWNAQRFASAVPESFVNRENRATVTALLLDTGRPEADRLLQEMSTATDVLRLAAGLSGGDVSLAEQTKFVSFSRKIRRDLLALLESANDPLDDMLRRTEEFKRLGERLHPGEHRIRFPNAARAFDVIRQGLDHETFNSRIETLILSGDSVAATRLLSTRPGILARRLDELVRLRAEHAALVITEFESVASDVATRVLLQARAHFASRGTGRLRAFFPKGNISRVRTVPDQLPSISEESRARIVAVLDAALVKRFVALPPLGKVYIDPAMALYAVPLSARSASRSLRTAGRGSHLPLPDAEVLRFFIWWQDQSTDNERARVDLDLSAVLYDETFAKTAQIAYYNLRGSGCTHSGDITSAPQGASEFIDIERAKLQRNGYRYVVMVVTSYTEQPFNELPGCFAGVMGRGEPQSGEIYDPATVLDRWDLSGDKRIAVPLIIDLQSNELIWTDLTFSNHLQSVNAVANNNSSLASVVEAMVEFQPPTVQDLLVAHAQARGKLVTNRVDADFVVALDGDLSPLDLDRLMAEFV
ncbi:hypothetical protein ASD81_10765 [Nocardioides sp. Root614]|nr:hypothetical protein ASD81_10765 [Nocardioides sp. Root614]KRA92991.1 hypothetical protein ASD84_11030 [Nocardioides sp. Root682]